MALPLLKAVRPTQRLVADETFDADGLRIWLAERHIEPIRSGRAACDVVYPLNRKGYRRRNVIERLFVRLKNRKRIATRYDRSAITLVATVTQWFG